MAKKTDTVTQNFEHQFGAENRFDKMSDLHMRFTMIRDRMREKMKEWKAYLQAYRRYPIARAGGRKDANYGGLKFEIDNSIDLFQSLVLNRQTWATITPLIAPDKATQLKWSRQISECWHEQFIRQWQEKGENTSFDFYDMQMFMAGIEFWPNPGDVYPENLPIEHCFPDLMAEMNPRKWETLFILRRVSYNRLYQKTKSKSSGWNSEAIEDMLLTSSNRPSALSEFEKLRLDTKDSTNTDNSVLLIHAYVKEYDKSVTHYIFPEDGILISQARGATTPREKEERYLFVRKNYCKHMGQVVALRTYHRFKQYWAGESLADNIFIAKLQGDQAMNKILRSATRSATTYLNSNTPDTQEKLQGMGDQEVVVLDPDTKITQSNIQSNVGDLFQAVRQLDFDTSRMNQDYLPAGSQNVKGRAITAEESSNQAIQAVEKKEKKTTLFIQQDQRMVDELYRRSLKVTKGEDEGDRLERFEAKMQAYEIPKEAYAYKNVLVESTFSFMGGGQGARIQASEKLIGFTRIKPESEGVARAKNEAISSLVGYEMAEYYQPKVDIPNETQARLAGFENEILDNYNLNPMNAQVLADDDHVLHIEKHFPDIENDLGRIQEMLKLFTKLPPPDKAVYVYKFQDQVTATDNKFAHSIAHGQMMSMDPGLEQYTQVFEQKIAQLRAAFQGIQNLVKAAIDQYAQETQQNAFLTEEQRIKIETMAAELEHAKAMNDVALGKAVEQAKLRQITGEQKIKQDQDKHISKLQAQETKEGIDIEHKIRKSATDIAAGQLSAIQKAQDVPPPTPSSNGQSASAPPPGPGGPLPAVPPAPVPPGPPAPIPAPAPEGELVPVGEGEGVL